MTTGRPTKAALKKTVEKPKMTAGPKGTLRRSSTPAQLQRMTRGRKAVANHHQPLESCSTVTWVMRLKSRQGSVTLTTSTETMRPVSRASMPARSIRTPARMTRKTGAMASRMADMRASSGKPGYSSPTLRAARKASWGSSTLPMLFMRRLPSFCFSRSLRLRVMSPP